MIYLDSEFNSSRVLCFVAYQNGARLDFDTRDNGEDFARYIERNRDEIFCAFSITAEIESMLRLGITPPNRWVDLMPEASQIICTHEDFRFDVVTLDGLMEVNPRTPSMLEAVRILCGESASVEDKKEMRNLILSQDDWTPEEFTQIVDYCASDTVQLIALWETIKSFHKRHQTPWELGHALYRGKTTLNIVTMLHEGTGFPVDEAWLKAIYDNRVRVIHAEVDNLATVYVGYSLFLKTDDGARENLSEIKRFAADHNLPWALSEKTSRVVMREDYLSPFVKEVETLRDQMDAFAKACPSLKAFKECRDLIIQLRKNLWTEGDPKRFQPPLIQGGYVKAISIPFYTKSGRSQPLVNRGHILNARPFIRTAIRPPAGKVVIALDWSQQEIAIALRFFPDRKLREAYETGDLYLALAKMAGAVPPEGTKKTHEFERQQFKSVQLGLAYGMGPVSLGRKLFADLNFGKETIIASREYCERKAEEIFEWHKDTFYEYWEGVESFIEDSIDEGWCLSEDMWLYFADEETPKTQLQNIRMQANGATMMHFALNALAKTGINFLAEHHDALYVACDEAEADAIIARVRGIMDDAARATIGSDIRIRIDAKTYTNETGYQDARADSMVALLKKHI